MCDAYYCFMRYKGLSVCLLALLVFFGLRPLMQRFASQPNHLAVVDGGMRPVPAHNHLASLASLAVGALAFAVIPGRRKQSQAQKTNDAASAPEAVVRCPQCDRTMTRILIAAGEHRGRTMWLCPQSPDCQVPPLSRRRRMTFVRHAS